MSTILNANGGTYYIEAKFEAGLDNIYLLSYYGEKEEAAIQAGANPIRFVVASGWNEKTKEWDCEYYHTIWNEDPRAARIAKKEAFLDFVDQVKRIGYHYW